MSFNTNQNSGKFAFFFFFFGNVVDFLYFIGQNSHMLPKSWLICWFLEVHVILNFWESALVMKLGDSESFCQFCETVNLIFVIAEGYSMNELILFGFYVKIYFFSYSGIILSILACTFSCHLLHFLFLFSSYLLFLKKVLPSIVCMLLK